MIPVSSFVIDRALWLRGEGSEKSTLFRPDDGKMCCLGLYLSACGVDAYRMRNVGHPGLLTDAVPSWTASAAKDTPVERLIAVNDDEEVPEQEREKVLVDLFEQQGVAVTFIGA